eukprot:tig00020703_g13104.t1
MASSPLRTSPSHSRNFFAQSGIESGSSAPRAPSPDTAAPEGVRPNTASGAVSIPDPLRSSVEALDEGEWSIARLAAYFDSLPSKVASSFGLSTAPQLDRASPPVSPEQGRGNPLAGASEGEEEEALSGVRRCGNPRQRGHGLWAWGEDPAPGFPVAPAPPLYPLTGDRERLFSFFRRRRDLPQVASSLEDCWRAIVSVRSRRRRALAEARLRVAERREREVGALGARLEALVGLHFEANLQHALGRVPALVRRRHASKSPPARRPPLPWMSGVARPDSKHAAFRPGGRAGRAAEAEAAAAAERRASLRRELARSGDGSFMKQVAAREAVRKAELRLALGALRAHARIARSAREEAEAVAADEDGLYARWGWTAFLVVSLDGRRRLARAARLFLRTLRRPAATVLAAWRRWTFRCVDLREKAVQVKAAARTRALRRGLRAMRGAVARRAEKEERRLLALEYYRSRLPLRLFRCWAAYAVRRRMRAAQKQLADLWFRCRPLAISLHTWLDNVRSGLIVKNRLLPEDMRRRSALWRLAFLARIHARDAAALGRFNLLRRIFGRLCLAASRRRAMERLADEQRARVLLRAWHRWWHQLEQTREMKVAGPRRRRVLPRAWRRWRAFVVWKHSAAAAMELVNARRVRAMAATAIAEWRRAVAGQQLLRRVWGRAVDWWEWRLEAPEYALQFHNLAHYFTRWRTLLRFSYKGRLRRASWAAASAFHSTFLQCPV